MAGTTLYSERYRDDAWDWVDTPGIVTDSDAATVKEALASLESADSIVVVLRSYRAAEELKTLLPLVSNKKVVFLLTFADKLVISDEGQRNEFISTWKEKLGAPVLLLDASKPSQDDLNRIRKAVTEAKMAHDVNIQELPGLVTKKSPSYWLQVERVLGWAPMSFVLLFFPAWIAVSQANALADSFQWAVSHAFESILGWANALPAPLAATLGGDYGILAMFPFLLLYALPTILIFTILIGFYKSTGLIDRLSFSLHPILRPFGIGGRDLVRVVMGFGCNVPAVISTRACSSCSRGTCVSTICFGSACSYQLPATLAVFAAAGLVWLGPCYLIVLAITTLIYIRMVTPRSVRQSQNLMMEPPIGQLCLPDIRSILRETLQCLKDFLIMALPIFIGICIIAGLLQWSGVLSWLSSLLKPVMAVLNLPPEAALSIVLGSVRKDGIAIGLLDSEWNALKVPIDSPVQILTVVYLAGVLLPCLVTAITVAKEMRPRFALKMIARQAAFAVAFSLCIAWLGVLFISLKNNILSLNPLF